MVASPLFWSQYENLRIDSNGCEHTFSRVYQHKCHSDVGILEWEDISKSFCGADALRACVGVSSSQADVCMVRGLDFPQTCKSCKMRICLISTKAFLIFIAIHYVSDAYRIKIELFLLIKN